MKKNLALGLANAQEQLAVIIDNPHLGSFKILQVPKSPCPDQSE